MTSSLTEIEWDDTYYSDGGSDQRRSAHPKRTPRSPTSGFDLRRGFDQTPTRREEKALIEELINQSINHADTS